MIDEQRVMRYASVLARNEISFLVGPDIPLPGQDHPHWELWKRDAADVIKIADEEHPPPPNSTVKKLPDEILALITKLPYISTACDVARMLQSAILRHPDDAEALAMWRDIKHSECRENNKHTDMPCTCGCHNEVE